MEMGWQVSGGETLAWVMAEPPPTEPREAKDEGLLPSMLLLAAAWIPSGASNRDAWRLIW